MSGCRHPEYSLRVRNIGQREIDNVEVTYEGHRSAPGVLMPGAQDTELAVPHPLPKRATVRWRDADLKEHREAVDVTFAQTFKGVLVFEIDELNRVKVRTESPPRHID